MIQKVRCTLASAVALGVTGCAIQSPSADPFAGAAATPDRLGRHHRVTLEVLCEQECAITYSFAGRAESLTWNASIWRRSFNLYPRFVQAIRLTASGQVERVRIYVGGDIVAEDERGPATFNTTLTAETVIPSPPPPPVPDTVNLEGGGPDAPTRG
jgi:hypothetical protein